MTSTLDLTGIVTYDPLLDVDVMMSINHPFVGDLEVELLYAGHTVDLVNRRGGTGDNFTDTRFNDGASSSITTGTAPFTGQFRPEQPQCLRRPQSGRRGRYG